MKISIRKSSRMLNVSLIFAGELNAVESFITINSTEVSFIRLCLFSEGDHAFKVTSERIRWACSTSLINFDSSSWVRSFESILQRISIAWREFDYEITYSSDAWCFVNSSGLISYQQQAVQLELVTYPNAYRACKYVVLKYSNNLESHRCVVECDLLRPPAGTRWPFFKCCNWS